MKNTLIKNASLLAGLLVVASCGNDDSLSVDQIPSEIASDFDSRHANVSGITWEKEGDFYEAEWTENGIEKEIVYDLDGNWVQSECEISLDQVPQAAVDYIESNYPGAVLEEAETVTRAEADFVEVEIQDGSKERELLFTDSGEFVEEIIEADDDNDDDDNG